MRRRKTETELPIEPPISFWGGSNGEAMPRERTDLDLRAEELFHRISADRARKMGISRRAFVESAAGTATALAVINLAYGCGDKNGALRDAGVSQRMDAAAGGDAGFAEDGRALDPEAGGRDAIPAENAGDAADGGFYDVDADMTQDAGSACRRLDANDFIFDVQTHQVNPNGAWRQSPAAWELFLGSLPQANCGVADRVDCFDTRHYLREMFVNSDTHVAVLSAVPAETGRNPLEIEEAAATRALFGMLEGSPRVVIHGLVLPDRGQAQLDGMQRLAEELDIAAWKVYTPYGGWRLDSPTVGIPFIERARALGVKIICAHKGLPLPGFDANFAAPDDVGVVAAMFPDVKFVIYHSAYDTSVTEGPYSPTGRGVDRLIKSLQDNNIGPNQNVYAELGTTWRSVMTRPTQAAHVIGKLLRHVGEDRVVWGTDSIWYGSPQDQIMAFRAFEIPMSLQMMHGYPALTPAIKAKVFGLSSAAAYGIDPHEVRCAISEDDLSRLRLSMKEEGPLPSFKHYGPRTRRELLAFLRARGGFPG